MSLLLVTYELNKSGQFNSDLINEINNYSNVRLSDTSYAIITDKSPSRVCGELKQYIDANDKIFVISLKRPFDGYGSDEINDWLRKTLTN
jgi:sugar-specific transcriptional regulator TrmB